MRLLHPVRSDLAWHLLHRCVRSNKIATLACLCVGELVRNAHCVPIKKVVFIAERTLLYQHLTDKAGQGSVDGGLGHTLAVLSGLQTVRRS